MLVSPSQSAPGETIDAADINTPINQLASAINGNLDDDNITSVSGSKLVDGTVTNAKLSTTAGELGGAWTTWTPTFSGLSGGTLNYARYTKVGKHVSLYWKYTLAGAGVSGDIAFTLPVNTSSTYSTTIVEAINGSVTLRAAGASYQGVVTWNSVTQLRIRGAAVSGTAISHTSLSSGFPATWGSGDTIYVACSYEAA